MKAALLCLIVPLLILVERVSATAAVTLSAVHVGGLAVAGFCLATIFAVELPRPWPDRLAVSYLAGWGAVPLVVLAAYTLGSLGWALVITFGGLGAAALCKRGLARAPAPPRGGDVPASIPLGVYLLALGYVVISVGIPFAHFSPSSIVRELFVDGVQRFGTAYALADGLPPHNPFVAGAPLQYYWFFLVPHAVEYRFVHADLFAVWKCAQTWTPMLFLPGLWSLLQVVFRSRTVAWAALAFGFVFASYEILVSPELVRALAEGLGPATDWWALARGLLAEAVTSDPDMRIGLITVYSDQLLMEDFIYLPQNGVALIVTLLALWYANAGRIGAATFTLSSLAGFNTFFTIPAYTAFTAMLAMRSGMRRAALGALALGAYSLVWLRICLIVEWIPLAAAVVLAIVAAGLLRAVGPTPRAEPAADEPLSARWLRAAAWAYAVALALVVTLRPIRNGAVLLLTYGPGLVLGLAFVGHLALRGARRLPADGRSSLLFLLVAGTVSALVSWFLYLQFLSWAPESVQHLSAALGREVNLFNFHHKTWKLSRLGWAILAGLLLEHAGTGWRAQLAARPVLTAATLVLLTPAALTGLVRPFTYLGPGPVSEGAAAEYLRRHGHGIETRVLLENFRESRLSLLVPISTFYFSSWAGGGPGLIDRPRAWADQYLPPRARPESPRREALTLRFFAPGATQDERARILSEERIDYVLTRTPLDLAPVATLVTGEDGGYLYRVSSPGRDSGR